MNGGGVGGGTHFRHMWDGETGYGSSVKYEHALTDLKSRAVVEVGDEWDAKGIEESGGQDGGEGGGGEGGRGGKLRHTHLFR